MKAKENLVPVKKILGMINSCENETQLDKCKVIIENYIKSARKSDLANVAELQDRLHEEMLQRQEALYLVKIFNA
jgi:hypothetical protein